MVLKMDAKFIQYVTRTGKLLALQAKNLQSLSESTKAIFDVTDALITKTKPTCDVNNSMQQTADLC